MQLIWFTGAIVLLLVLSRLTSRSLGLLLGEGWYTFLLWPGVIIHEFSHLLGALITFTRVRGFSIMPEDRHASPGGGRVLGFVQHDEPRGAITLVIVSAAPFIGGMLALQLAAHLLIPSLPTTLPPIFGQSLGALLAHWQTFAQESATALVSAGTQGWIFLYLLLALGAHLAPSTHDLRYTSIGIAGLALCTALLALVEQLFRLTLIGSGLRWLGMSLVNILTPVWPNLSYTILLLSLAALLAYLLVALWQLIANILRGRSI